MQYNKQKFDRIEIVPNRYANLENNMNSLDDILNDTLSGFLIRDVHGKFVLINNEVLADKIGQIARICQCESDDIDLLIKRIKEHNY